MVTQHGSCAGRVQRAGAKIDQGIFLFYGYIFNVLLPVAEVITREDATFFARVNA